jgi:hypothetical protein
MNRIAVVGVLCIYAFFLVGKGQPLCSPKAMGHYQYLTEALLSGQTYFKVQPNPALAGLDNPYAGPQGVPRLHDATYFKGRYYLYFGVTPVLLLLGPWALVTGSYLTDSAAVLVFCSGGFLVSVVIWSELRRRSLQGVKGFAPAFGTIVLGLGNYIIILMAGTQFYQVANAAAYFCLMVAFWCVLRLSAAPSTCQQDLWMALASAFWGLLVGSRPNLAASLPALGAVALFLVGKRGRRDGWSRVRTWSILAAAIVPAFLFGCGLAAYNYARFQDPFEFGIHYQFAAGDMRHVKLAGLRFIPGNLTSYLFTPCRYHPYYPFVELTGPAFGVLTWAPFSALVLFFPLSLLLLEARRNGPWFLVGFAVSSTALLSFASLLMYTGPVGRYALDFLPAATLGSVLFWGAAVARGAYSRGWRTVAIIGGMTAIFSMAHALLLTLPYPPESAGLSRLVRWLDYPSGIWDRIAGTRYGPVVGEIRFQEQPAGTWEPLVATGGGRDVLFIEHRGENKIRFGFFHLGTQSPFGEELSITPNHTYQFQFSLGSLYPPMEHPVFSKTPPAIVRALRRGVEVILDGAIVYRAFSDFYVSNPGQVLVGANPSGVGTTPRFSGQLTIAGRKGMPPISQFQNGGNPGAVRLTLRFPEFRGVVGEPLISTGPRREGDLVFVYYLRPGKMRLGVDSAQGGATETRELSYDPAIDHVLDVDLPPLHDGSAKATSRAFEMRFDGQVVMRLKRRFVATSSVDTVFGYNAVLSTAAAASFTGPKLQISPITLVPSPLSLEPAWGPIRLILMLPANRIGAQEPLVVTGKSGAGDFVYIVYADPQHIRIGYDHWGVGGILSDPVPIDYGKVNAIEVSMGSLYPDFSDPWWSRQNGPVNPQAKRTVWVKVNDSVVLNQAYDAHPSSLQQIVSCKNPIGGSSCGSEFTGTLQEVEHCLVPDELK